jgi:hypothetical protein
MYFAPCPGYSVFGVTTQGHCLKIRVFYHRGEVQRAQSFKTDPSLCELPRSAVKFKDIVITLGFSDCVPFNQKPNTSDHQVCFLIVLSN